MEKIKTNISVLEYFNKLQLEYKLYELRSKIYPFSDDKKKFKEVLEYKKKKILDISQKNSLNNIFNNKEKDLEIELLFSNEIGVPQIMTKKDKYFYYYPKSEFSYSGAGCKLVKYDFESNSAEIESSSKTIIVSLDEIKRIL